MKRPLAILLLGAATAFGQIDNPVTRDSLGISNTFAGQFHADFYDDFSRYTNGTVVGDGFTPIYGSNYSIRFGSTNYSNPPIVTNKTLVSTNGEVFYLTTDLDRPVYNFGAVFEFDQQNGGNNVTLLIQPDTAWIGRVVHISATPFGVAVDVSTNGVAGFGGTNTIIQTNFGAGQTLLAGERQVLLGQIDGDTIYINYGGRNFRGSHPQLTNVVGNYFTFESFYTTNTLTNRIHAVWANSPSLQNFWSHSFNDSLAQIANGYGRLENNLIVATNPSAFVSELGTNKALFGGDVLIKGVVRGSVGDSSAMSTGAPMVHQKGGGTANTNTTNLMSLVTFNIIGNALAQDWSRWNGTYVGSFANNTNDKRVTINMAGVRLDTGLLSESGEWKVDVLVYRSTNNSHEGFAMFQSEQTTKTSRWTFNNGASVQFNITLDAAADANNDVILRGAWSDVFP